MCSQFLQHIHSPTRFPWLLPPPNGTNSPLSRTCYIFLFSNFVEEKRKKWHFCFLR
jgi:hypothetical protein